ncbi:MAG: hypothetical protein DMF86_06225 [Acidobacteria bacterium]|nr:MAG: hypothetical protein DMF86_06225 [Acidobacteriota bacterium]
MTDLRDAFRALRATPVVTAVAVLSLALGIGANTAIFSILDSLLLRSLPVRDPGRLAFVFCGPTRSSWTNPLWEAFRAHGLYARTRDVVATETFARKFFPGRRPLGGRVREVGRPGAPNPVLEIVGLVKDAVYVSLRTPVPPTMYLAVAQQKEAGSSMNVSVRASGSPSALSRAIAAAVTSVDPKVSFTFRPLAGEIDGALTQERLVAMLSGFFGALALLLAGLGLYGVMAYAVSRRRTEIGIRMALGAAPAGVVWIVLRRVAVLVCAGLVIGTAASLWLSRFVATLLFGLEPRDPATLMAAAVVLSAIGLRES